MPDPIAEPKIVKEPEEPIKDPALDTPAISGVNDKHIPLNVFM